MNKVQKLEVARLISNGMIMQRNTKVRIWGNGNANSTVSVTLFKDTNKDTLLRNEVIKETTKVNKDRSWEVWLTLGDYGVDYELVIEDSNNEKIIIEDVCIGDVFMCSGQSNMELPMDRVKDTYKDEVKNCEYPYIRQYKIVEHTNYHGPIDDLETGSWIAANTKTVGDFSAVAYFCARKLQGESNLPIGLINASLGGSPIQGWMGKEMLEGCDEDLAIAERYKDDIFVKSQMRKNMEESNDWYQALNSKDAGIQDKWYESDLDFSSWNAIDLPVEFKDVEELNGLIGSVWLRRIIDVKPEMVGVPLNFWFGTMVDTDWVYVNGKLIGSTPYQYPPRKYTIPAGVLHEGKNTITIRIVSETGYGRVTKDKHYGIFAGDNVNTDNYIDLSGRWSYCIGAEHTTKPGMDFISWKPTGLYNGMVAPCHKYTICAVLWYQGEANILEALKYGEYSKRMVKGYREKWGNKDLPFFYVQMPNLKADMPDVHSGFPNLREEQERFLQYPNVGMACSIDVGEDNDWHPTHKKEIGDRLGLLVKKFIYHEDIEYSGPVVESIKVQKENNNDYEIELVCSHANGLRIHRTVDAYENKFEDMSTWCRKKTDEILDFEVAGTDGKYHKATAKIEKENVIVSIHLDSIPMMVRYCHSNSPQGALLYNEQDLPMAPFERQI